MSHNNYAHHYGALDRYTHDMTAHASTSAYTPIQKYHKEVTRIFQILLRERKNNPLLIGEPQAGRNAIVEELSRRVAYRDVPEKIKTRHIMALDLEALVKDTVYRGEFDERLLAVLNEVRDADHQYILLIDDLHRFLAAGVKENCKEAANILIPALSRNEVQIVGTTREREYHQYIERDPSLLRRFQEIIVQA